jgi:hypothetical protein
MSRRLFRLGQTEPGGKVLAIMTRREYLMFQALEAGAGVLEAQEAVSSVAIEHPEWNMDEERAMSEWFAQG